MVVQHLGGGRKRDLGPGAAITPSKHHVTGTLDFALPRQRQIPRPPDDIDPPEDHQLAPRTISACRDAIWNGDARQQRYGLAVIEYGSVRRAAEALGVTPRRVWQVVQMAKAA